MRYSRGEVIKLGDTVKLWNGNKGTVVCSIDTGEYSDEYPKSDWDYLKKGILVYSLQAGLIHYEDPEPDIILVNRG